MNEFKFGDDGKARYYGSGGESDVIMTVWIENGSVCMTNNTECDDIQIPVSVISKLILNADISIIRSQLKEYIEKV
jgi:hypothetical protein